MSTENLIFQPDLPIYCKKSVTLQDVNYKRGDALPWLELSMPEEVVAILHQQGLIYHSRSSEIETMTGDRLMEMTFSELDDLTKSLNDIVRKKSSSTAEYTSNRCKRSKLVEKQKLNIRKFLDENPWITEDYYSIRDSIIDT